MDRSNKRKDENEEYYSLALMKHDVHCTCTTWFSMDILCNDMRRTVERANDLRSKFGTR